MYCPARLFYIDMKIFNNLFLIVFAIFLWGIVRADCQPVIVWDKVYGSYFDDSGIQIIATQEGGCVFTAWPFEPGSGDVPEQKGGRDVWGCKLDVNGEILYSRILGGSNDDFAASIMGTNDGGVIFQYGTLSSDFDIPHLIGENDEAFHKLDVDGKTEWVRVFGSTGGDSGLSLQKEDGNFLMYLYYGHNDGDLEDVEEDGVGALVIEFDQDCNALWKIPIDFQPVDEVFQSRIYDTADGGFVFGVSSKVNPGNHGASDICIWKYSPDRVIEWESCFGGEDGEFVRDILELPDGGFLIAAGTWSKGGDITDPLGRRDIWLLHLDRNGNLVSQRTMGGSGLDSIEKMILADGGQSAILLCYTSSDDVDVSFNHGGSDVWLVKIDLATKSIIWEKTYGSSTGAEFARDMVQLEDGSLIVLGEIAAGHGQDGDVTGETHSNHKDIWVFKLAPEEVQESNDCGGFTIMPNPASSNHVEIIFENLLKDDPDIRVFDIRGSLVTYYPSASLQGAWKAELELPQNLPFGIYLVQVEGCPQVGKLLKMN